MSHNPFKYGNKYCQHSEEDILLTIFDKISHRRTLCDIGARMNFSNARRLIEDYDYTGTLVDFSPKACRDIERIVGREGITVINKKVTVRNVNDLVGNADFLSIDIDTNDWWIWAHLQDKPRVVCIEFNNHLNGLTVHAYDVDMTKCNGRKHDQNASFQAMVLLGRLKGYSCVARTGVNAIFVDRDCNWKQGL